VGASYRLALPAGSALDHELTSYTADELTNSPHKLVIVIGTDHIPLLHSELAIHESDRSNDDVDFSSFQQHWTVPVPPECKGSKAACILKFVKNTPVFFYQKVNFVGKPISDWNYIFAEKTV
jgi:hypothetical protein